MSVLGKYSCFCHHHVQYVAVLYVVYPSLLGSSCVTSSVYFTFHYLLWESATVHFCNVAKCIIVISVVFSDLHHGTILAFSICQCFFILFRLVILFSCIEVPFWKLQFFSMLQSWSISQNITMCSHDINVLKSVILIFLYSLEFQTWSGLRKMFLVIATLLVTSASLSACVLVTASRYTKCSTFCSYCSVLTKSKWFLLFLFLHFFHDKNLYCVLCYLFQFQD